MNMPLRVNEIHPDQPAADRLSSVLPTGIGLRALHHVPIFQERPAVGFLEIHAENYMTDLTARIALAARQFWPISVHGVGLSLGGAEALDRDHLNRLARLVDDIEPLLVSEHVAWCRQGGIYLNDLLPLPYTEEALHVLVDHVSEVQDKLGRQILMENPSTYLQYNHATLSEGAFLAELARRSGCGLLLDVNNLYVNQRNHGFDPLRTFTEIDPATVKEIHLAGHHEAVRDKATILIDDHGCPVSAAVWSLYDVALQRFAAPTLIEWDSRLPDLDVLVAEASVADRHRADASGRLAASCMTAAGPRQ
ncbi:MAG TPA: DUF692 domain-containing protein [Terriglobales bacterium]|nr:DUF692 domain-containing protein [Terriglobales bacterium]